MKTIMLLDGASICVRYNEDAKEWTATAMIGYTSIDATDIDPVRAIGLAVMLKAGYTENTLKKTTMSKG